MPQFTVIIPTRNRPHYLDHAIQSVLDQTCTDFELLIVNDGEDAVRGGEDRRIRVLDNKTRGAVAARNLGIAEARGEYIAFLDDDDVWTDAAHLLTAAQSLNSNSDFYFADGMMQFPDGSSRVFAQAANAKTLQRDNTILISTVCYKSSLHKALGLFDEALPYYWDWDWYLRVANASFAIHRDPHAVVDIRVHAQNMSRNENVNHRQANLDLLIAKHGLGQIILKNHADFT
jgi:glycosyltransferase involved in cell wall biosynthesis